MSVHVPPRPAVPFTSLPGRKAGPFGAGAGPLLNGLPLESFLNTDPSKKMAQAWNLGTQVAYIFAAERVIAGKLSTVAWHLEDPDGETIDDTYPDTRAREAFTLLEKPQINIPLRDIGVRRSRRQIWELTGRHIGLCGNSAWGLDQMDGFGVPRAILYIRPDRLTPDITNKLLRGWTLDKYAQGSQTGVAMELEEVLLFHLQAPNEGFFSTGLVEAALVKAKLNGSIDRHFASVIAGGGRLSGIIAPKEGAISDDGIYNQMVADWRNVTEQSDSARRVQIVRAPVNFTPTVNTPAEMGLIDLMGRNRDDLLALWGVPFSQVGGSPAAGMNGGEARDSDRAALWENAVIPRLEEMREQIQGLLDRFVPDMGWAPTLVIDYPDLETATSKYDKLAKSGMLAMRNWERRALIGMDPFGEKVIGTTGNRLDDEVWVPLTVTPMLAAPEDGILTPIEEEPVDEPTVQDEELLNPDAPEPDEIPEEFAKKAKSLVAASAALRTKVRQKLGPHLQSAVQKVLNEQKKDVVAKVLGKWTAILAKPRDATLWWKNAGPGGKSPWDEAMSKALKPGVAGVATAVNQNVAMVVKPGKAASAAPAAVERVLKYGARRVKYINSTTRDGIKDIIAQGVRDGLSPREVGDLIEGWAGFNEYRAERIATTELQFAYNQAAIEEYKELGVKMVEAIDGDEDEECAERNGKVFTLAEAAEIEDHPNGTLDWVPVIE